MQLAAGGSRAQSYVPIAPEFGYVDQRDYGFAYPPQPGTPQFNPYYQPYASLHSSSDHLISSRRPSEQQLDSFSLSTAAAPGTKGARRLSELGPNEVDPFAKRDSSAEILEGSAQKRSAGSGSAGVGGAGAGAQSGLPATLPTALPTLAGASMSGPSISGPSINGSISQYFQNGSLSSQGAPTRHGSIYQAPVLPIPRMMSQTGQYQFVGRSAQAQAQQQQQQQQAQAQAQQAQARAQIRTQAAQHARSPPALAPIHAASTRRPKRARKTKRKRGSESARTSRASGAHPARTSSKPTVPPNTAARGSDGRVLVPASEAMRTEDGRPLIGATKVDQLMLVIQARRKGLEGDIKQAEDGTILEEVGREGAGAPSVVPSAVELVGGVEKTKIRGRKMHQCQYCMKKFTQSTHLEVHIRSHIGLKPYQCRFCGKRFTQGGNLRTHLRLHTGEKPFHCGKCGKSFSRKGNLQAHLLTHQNIRPFKCKFDNCGKAFTQLGNLKAHQNRFHQATINTLTNRLAHMHSAAEIDELPERDRELLKYFAGLYKNLNRGIRGRGKKR